MVNDLDDPRNRCLAVVTGAHDATTVYLISRVIDGVRSMALVDIEASERPLDALTFNPNMAPDWPLHERAEERLTVRDKPAVQPSFYERHQQHGNRVTKAMRNTSGPLRGHQRKL